MFIRELGDKNVNLEVMQECTGLMNLITIRSNAFALQVLLGFVFIVSILVLPEVDASFPDDCQGMNYRPEFVPKNMTVAEKKRRFRCLVQADIDAVFVDLYAQYTVVLNAVSKDSDNEELKRLRIKYGVNTNQELVMAIKPHPRSVAIAQAAIESGWGTSQIFVKANNIFGIRPFKKGQPRIAATRKRGDKTIWLRKYASMRESIVDYYLVLGRASAYSEFRDLKMKTTDTHKLVAKLINYSERKASYVHELSSIIRYNKFHELDW